MPRPRSLAVCALVLAVSGCSSAPAPNLVGFCAAYAEYERFGSQDPPDQRDPAEVQASFEGTKSRIEALLDAAPTEISDDVTRLIQQFDDVRRTLEGAGYDLAAVREEVSATFDDPENIPVRERIGRFNAENCSEGSPNPEPGVPIGSSPAP